MKKPLILALAMLGLAACSDVDTGNKGNAETDQHEAATSVVGMDFFHGSWEEALSKAESENKKLFVDVYTEWCGPCKLMAANIFPLPEVGEYYNARFINIKLDAEDEDINGPELSDRYDVRAYPTYLFLNADGSEISRAVGGMGAEQFISLAGQILGEHNGNFDDLIARYDSGERDVTFVRQYLNGAQLQMSLIKDREKSYALRTRMKKVAKEYVESRGKENLFNEEDFAIIAGYWGKSPRGDEMAEFVIDNYDKFVAVAPEISVAEFVLDSNWYGALNAAQAGDPIYKEYSDDYDGKLAKAVAFRKANDTSDVTDIERAKQTYHRMYLEATKAWGELHQIYEKQLQKNPSSNAYMRAAGTLGRAEEDKYRKISREYARKGYEMGLTDAFDVMTYTNILKSDGRGDEAQKVLEEYRNGLGDSAEDKKNRQLLDRLTGPVELPPMVVSGTFTFTEQMKEYGADPATLEAMVWKFKEPGSKSKGMVDELRKVPVVDGKFELSVPVTEMHYVGLAIIANDGKMTLSKADMILEPGTVTADMDARKVSGGDAYQKIYGWKSDPEYQRLQAQQMDVRGKFKEGMPEAEQKALMEEFNKVSKAMNAIPQKSLMEVAKNHPVPQVRFLAVNARENGLTGEERLERLKKMQATLPGYKSLQHAITRIESAMGAQARSDAIKVGTVIKDFEAQDLEGNNFKVSDVMAKNKYVLVEFWASWCGPCRAEIPHMKKAYEHFNSKGFEIVSFTLDDDKESWEEASEEESLPWVNVGDLQSFSSPIVQMYGVRGVPANYLVEGSTGKIVGKDLRQEQLDEKLAELLK